MPSHLGSDQFLTAAALSLRPLPETVRKSLAITPSTAFASRFFQASQAAVSTASSDSVIASGFSVDGAEAAAALGVGDFSLVTAFSEWCWFIHLSPSRMNVLVAHTSAGTLLPAHVASCAALYVSTAKSGPIMLSWSSLME